MAKLEDAVCSGDVVDSIWTPTDLGLCSLEGNARLTAHSEHSNDLCSTWNIRTIRLDVLVHGNALGPRQSTYLSPPRASSTDRTAAPVVRLHSNFGALQLMLGLDDGQFQCAPRQGARIAIGQAYAIGRGIGRQHFPEKDCLVAGQAWIGILHASQGVVVQHAARVFSRDVRESTI